MNLVHVQGSVQKPKRRRKTAKVDERRQNTAKDIAVIKLKLQKSTIMHYYV